MQKHLPVSVLILLGTTLFTLLTAARSKQPNIVIFAVDDMCDWIGPMGHDQAITPHMDRLAEKGVTFQNAHTAGSFCAPSRSAIFTGRFASTTGCYNNELYFVDHPEIKPLQMRLQEGGYTTHGAGKLFHHPGGYVDLRGWDEFFVRSESQKAEAWALNSWEVDDPILPDPYPASIYNHDQKPVNRFFMEWGKVLNDNEEKMADTIRANWACDLVGQKHEKPFLVAVGLYSPHFPNYAPAKYFDLYDPDQIQPPPYLVSDLDDLPEPVKRAKTNRSRIHKRLESLNAIEDAIHGYLACISYADAMLGRVLDAIESGPNADNTVIVLWSDHGYHHGEKYDWGKHTLWERTSNVPFMWAGPGIAKGKSIDATVSLIDIFPTLMEMSSLPGDTGHEGVSLAKMLNNPHKAKDRDVMLPGLKPGEYAIMNQDWRYIHYADGSEELYDIRQDPNEWHNLAGNPEMTDIKKKLQSSAPDSFAEPGTNKSQLNLVISGDNFRWEHK